MPSLYRSRGQARFTLSCPLTDGSTSFTRTRDDRERRPPVHITVLPVEGQQPRSEQQLLTPGVHIGDWGS